MSQYLALEKTIDDYLRHALSSLKEADPMLRFMACGMVEDLTGFFVAGAGTTWLSTLKPKNQGSAWWPSEWPLVAKDDAESPSLVTQEIWALSGTQAMLDGTGQEIPDDEYDALRTTYENLIIVALQNLRDEGLLHNANGQEIWAWCNSADDSFEDLDDRSFSAIQPQAISSLFVDRFSGKDQELLGIAIS